MGDVAALTWPLTGPFSNHPRKVNRSLFGEVNHEKAALLFEEHMDALMKEKKQRWNFDFENDRPLPPGRYLWEKVEKHKDTDTKDTSVSPEPDTEEIASSNQDNQQTHITDFMRKRKSSNKKDFVTQPLKIRRRSST